MPTVLSVGWVPWLPSRKDVLCVFSDQRKSASRSKQNKRLLDFLVGSYNSQKLGLQWRPWFFKKLDIKSEFMDGQNSLIFKQSSWNYGLSLKLRKASWSCSTVTQATYMKRSRPYHIQNVSFPVSTVWRILRERRSSYLQCFLFIVRYNHVRE